MIYLFLILSGLALGSFTNALVWRLHEKENKKSKYSKKNLSIIKGRSICPCCGHQLTWEDLFPVFSWLFLKGKCRYCSKPISWQYPLVELAVASLLPLSYYFWPFTLASAASYANFILWVLLTVILVSLFVYDFRWMILPTQLVYGALVVSILFTIGTAIDLNTGSVLLSSVIGSIALGGLFWLIYQISDGKWIGGGDVRLGFAMGMFLGWQKALLGLSLAAYIGTVIVIGAALMGKYHKRMKLPFGPLLIVGWTITLLFGQQMIDWYLRIIGVS